MSSSKPFSRSFSDSTDIRLGALDEQRLLEAQLELVVVPDSEGAEGEERLVLRDLSGAVAHPLSVDFVSSAMTYRRERGLGKNQPLFKALGLKSLDAAPFVFDCTSGLGVDAFMMASLGCRVRSVERSAIVHALLADGYARLRRFAQRSTEKDDGDRGEILAIAGRLSFECGDAGAILRALPESDRPDVVYVDPMYPEEGKSKSALPKKGMQLFRRLIGEDLDAESIFEAARSVARKRIVVKRGLKAPPLAGKPTHVFEGKTARFDMYLSGTY